MIDELYKYRDSLIRQEIDNYNEEYKASKWYREPTLKDILGPAIYSDYCALERALQKENKDEIQSLITSFEQAAHNYGASWWDDDLGCERTGSEWEVEFYVTLRNIAARTMGLPDKNTDEFYEGRGI